MEQNSTERLMVSWNYLSQNIGHCIHTIPCTLLHSAWRLHLHMVAQLRFQPHLTSSWQACDASDISVQIGVTIPSSPSVLRQPL